MLVKKCLNKVATNNKFKKILYPPANLILRSYGYLYSKIYDLNKTIVISSSPRGGSTWLAEIIQTLPKRLLLWEPFHLFNNPKCERYGFEWQNYFPRQAYKLDKMEYIKKILSGEDLSTRLITSHEFHPKQLLSFKGYVVKFVNANMILYEMMQHFHVKGILLLRHPCAVVSSQMIYGGWSKTRKKENIYIPDGLFADYPHLEQIYEDIEEYEECLAFLWSIQTYVPLTQPKPHPWYLTTYEKVVEFGKEEIDCLFNYLNKPTPKTAYIHLNIPSATTVNNSQISKKKSPLEGWRNNLSNKQIDRILNIVHRVGIDFYTETLLPDYQKLLRFKD